MIPYFGDVAGQARAILESREQTAEFAAACRLSEDAAKAVLQKLGREARVSDAAHEEGRKEGHAEGAAREAGHGLLTMITLAGLLILLRKPG